MATKRYLFRMYGIRMGCAPPHSCCCLQGILLSHGLCKEAGGLCMYPGSWLRAPGTSLCSSWGTCRLGQDKAHPSPSPTKTVCLCGKEESSPRAGCCEGWGRSSDAAASLIYCWDGAAKTFASSRAKEANQLVSLLPRKHLRNMRVNPASLSF